MAKTSRTVNLARSTVNCRCHVCAFSIAETTSTKSCCPSSRRASTWATEPSTSSTRTSVPSVCSDWRRPASTQASGQLKVRPWENAYLRHGGFDQYAMIDLLEEVAKV